MGTSRTRVVSWRYLLGIAAIAALGWFAFVRGESVPLLAAADLGFHELGHMLLAWAPEMLAALAGSATQVGVPVGLAVYFLVVRRDSLAGALMLGWAGTSAQNVSVYVADAPFEMLLLIGGQHDWAFLLGPLGWNVMRSAGSIASGVWVLGLLLLLGGLGLCIAGLVRGWLQARREEAEQARLATLPVREPSTRAVVTDSVSGR